MKTLREEIEGLISEIESDSETQRKIGGLLRDQNEENAAREVIGKSRQGASLAKTLRAILDRTRE